MYFQKNQKDKEIETDELKVVLKSLLVFETRFSVRAIFGLENMKLEKVSFLYRK